MTSTSKKLFIATALAFAATFGAQRTAYSSGFNQFVGLGDSTLDSGYFRYHSTGNPAADAQIAAAITAGANGGWAGNGIMDTTILAGKFGLNALPIGGGGTNYAIGGSLTASPSAGTVPLITQIATYLNDVNGFANPNALYVISSGNNDLAHLSDAQLPQESTALAVSVRRLQDAGAKYLLVPNSFRYANLVSLGGEITDNSNAAEYNRLLAYNTQRWNDLTAAGVHYIPADLDSVFQYVARNPTKFGFTPYTALATSAPSSVAAVLSVLTEEQQQTYLFVDGKHLTTAGQTIVADYEFSLLTAPGEISCVVENVIQSGLSRTATIQRQVELAGQTRGPNKVNGWAVSSYGYSKTETDSDFSNISGNPFRGTVGVDYHSAAGIIIGGAVTFGTQSQDFSTGGDFNQDDQTLSAYTAYQYNRFWGNAVASYGLLQNSINRSVKLGIFTDQNSADTDGHAFSLALRGGSDFKVNQFSTGPIVGVIFQEASIDAFVEHGTSGSTALSFRSQTRKSQVTQLGWRGSIELDAWMPFAEATWNHEFNNDARTMTTTLTSVAAPSFTSLSTPVATEWGNATFGVSYKINDKTLLWGAFSEVFGASENKNYGGEIGLRMSF